MEASKLIADGSSGGLFDPGKGIVLFTGDKATNQLIAVPSEQNMQFKIRLIFLFFCLRSFVLQQQ
jgi:hypothetical protein